MVVLPTLRNPDSMKDPFENLNREIERQTEEYWQQMAREEQEHFGWGSGVPIDAWKIVIDNSLGIDRSALAEQIEEAEYEILDPDTGSKNTQPNQNDSNAKPIQGVWEDNKSPD